ncbi:LOW QUALITY PROTEIN: olfactory receptor 1C1-like [Pterocles gutturalis]
MSLKSLQQGNLSSTMLLLLGFPSAYGARVTLCLCFMFIYLLVVLGNLLITSHIWLDAHQHSPTDFFLGHLSFLDICYSSVTLPKIPGDSSSLQKTISFVGCITQIYFLCSGGSKCVLLAAVGYGGLATCHPHCPALVNMEMCHCPVAVPWLSSSFSSLIQAFLTALPCGRSNVINPLFCEMPFLLKMSCSPNAPLNETVSRALAGTIVMDCLSSHIHIMGTVLQKAAGTQRPFATCTSRLTVGSLFFGAGSVAYLVPHSSGSKETDEALTLL